MKNCIKNIMQNGCPVGFEINFNGESHCVRLFGNTFSSIAAICIYSNHHSFTIEWKHD